MMMNKEDTKIKYLIGSFRDEPNYPTTEDFLYLMSTWYYNEGGKHFIHQYRAVEETGNICFTDVILKEKLNGDEKVTKDLLESLLKEGTIETIKETRFTQYYSINEKSLIA
jgi:Iap family predicted aminopeptidase